MQFQGYQINNLKSYRKYFCFTDAARALENGAYREWLCQMIPALERRGETVTEDLWLMREIKWLLDVWEGVPERTESPGKPEERQAPASKQTSAPELVSVRAYLMNGLPDVASYEDTTVNVLRRKFGKAADSAAYPVSWWETAAPDVQIPLSGADCGTVAVKAFEPPDGSEMDFGYIRQTRLLFLVHALARTSVIDVPAFLTCLDRMSDRTGRQAFSSKTREIGVTVLVTARTCLLRRHPDPFGGGCLSGMDAQPHEDAGLVAQENGFGGPEPEAQENSFGDMEPAAQENSRLGARRFVWKQLCNDADHPVTLLLAEQDRTVEARCLNPGGSVWYLERDGLFVRWGGRIQVDGESFACADRNGRLIVNGSAMKGGGMVDFSLDEADGILGVDARGRLKQYSRLAPEPADGVETVLAYLHGGQYWLMRPDGMAVTNMEQPPRAWLSAQGGPSSTAAVLPPEFPFAVSVVCTSSRLLGFETMDGRAGVWDTEQEKLIWMEE